MNKPIRTCKSIALPILLKVFISVYALHSVSSEAKQILTVEQANAAISIFADRMEQALNTARDSSPYVGVLDDLSTFLDENEIPTVWCSKLEGDAALASYWMRYTGALVFVASCGAGLYNRDWQPSAAMLVLGISLGVVTQATFDYLSDNGQLGRWHSARSRRLLLQAFAAEMRKRGIQLNGNYCEKLLSVSHYR